MGKNDEALGRYFADNSRYADLINGFVLNGQQVIKAEDLSSLESRTRGKKSRGTFGCKKERRWKYVSGIERIIAG